MAQNDLEWPILPNSQLFQSFPTKVAQNDLEWPISPMIPTEVVKNGMANFQSTFPFITKVAQNDLEWPILPNLQLFQSFPTEVAQNDLEWPISCLICNFSNLFPPKWLRMTHGQFCPICQFPTEVAQICNFSNLFPPKWLRMTWNGQSFPLNSQLFQSFLIFPTEVAQNDLEWPILPGLQLFQSFPTEVVQNDSEWPISPDSATFPIFSHQSGSE